MKVEGPLDHIVKVESREESENLEFSQSKTENAIQTEAADKKVKNAINKTLLFTKKISFSLLRYLQEHFRQRRTLENSYEEVHSINHC